MKFMRRCVAQARLSIFNWMRSWLASVFVKRKCEQKGPKKVSTFSTRFHVVSNVFPNAKCSPFEYRKDEGPFAEWAALGGLMLISPWGAKRSIGVQSPFALILST